MSQTGETDNDGTCQREDLQMSCQLSHELDLLFKKSGFFADSFRKRIEKTLKNTLHTENIYAYEKGIKEKMYERHCLFRPTASFKMTQVNKTDLYMIKEKRPYTYSRNCIKVDISSGEFIFRAAAPLDRFSCICNLGLLIFVFEANSRTIFAYNILSNIWTQIREEIDWKIAT